LKSLLYQVNLCFSLFVCWVLLFWQLIRLGKNQSLPKVSKVTLSNFDWPKFAAAFQNAFGLLGAFKHPISLQVVSISFKDLQGQFLIWKDVTNRFAFFWLNCPNQPLYLWSLYSQKLASVVCHQAPITSMLQLIFRRVNLLL